MSQSKNKGVTIATQSNGCQSAFIYVILGVALSIFTALCIPPSIKEMACFSGFVTLVCVILFRKTLMKRLTLISVPLFLLVAMTGLSVFYAPDRKLSFPEFCSLFIGFCVFMLFLLFAGGSAERNRGGMLVIALSTATTALISIDLLSTRVLYGAFRAVLHMFTTGYVNVNGVEAGIRMTSLYSASNVFAGIVGIGVLLSLGLAVSEEKKNLRILSLVALYLNALGFILVFSMGATGVIAVAFVVMLLLEVKERRIPLLVLMVETLVFTLISAVPIFATSFDDWSGFQPVPLVCAIVGCALFIVVHLRAGQVISEKLNQFSGVATALVGGVLVLAVAFGVIAYNWTGAITLASGEGLRRSAYPAGGSYTLELESDHALTVTIESQNEADTLNHTGTVIYTGDANGATFEVPEDSMVVYFNFGASEKTNVQTATLVGEDGSISLKLGYKLLPGFMANRLQGLWANENAIQRTAFFEDGLKIFQTSPIFGRGVGAFESLFRDIQEYDYGTRYVHNHYIQVMLETGIIGLIFFLSVLGIAAFALICQRKRGLNDTMLVTLSVCLMFMAGHAMVEVVFSMGTYLVVAMAVFAAIAIYTDDAVALPEAVAKGKLSQIILSSVVVFMSIWMVLISLNRTMPVVMKNSSHNQFLDNLKLAATLDQFDGDDFRYSCIVLATQYKEAPVIEQAKIYADDLINVEYGYRNLQRLASYYLVISDIDQAKIALDRMISLEPTNIQVWEDAFVTLCAGETFIDPTTFMATIAEYYAEYDANLAEIEGDQTLSDATNANIVGILTQS